MATRNRSGLVIEWRTPTVREVTVAVGLATALHAHPGIPELAAVGTGFIALGCLRVRRVTQPPDAGAD
ncbi:hypothetical protein [Streptomyces sp. NPDC052015]|uniref:hypothetical protein n=1 Tax=Streptomyces sp. NPDC052015 TaxID=3154755 RepID=UPI00342CEBF5